MNNNLSNFDWQFIGSAVLFITVIGLMILFRWNLSFGQKALKAGIGIFIISIISNILGLNEISDYLTVLGFVVITIALVRLFWDDTSNHEND